MKKYLNEVINYLFLLPVIMVFVVIADGFMNSEMLFEPMIWAFAVAAPFVVALFGPPPHN